MKPNREEHSVPPLTQPPGQKRGGWRCGGQFSISSSCPRVVVVVVHHVWIQVVQRVEVVQVINRRMFITGGRGHPRGTLANIPFR